MCNKHDKVDGLRERAIALRLEGIAYPKIENILSVNRSTLSGWLSKLKLSEIAKKRLEDNRLQRLKGVRVLAAQSHRRARIARIEGEKINVDKEFSGIKLGKRVLELLLSSFYLGEGVKRDNVVGLANSNPKILSAFINLMRWTYKLDESKFRCYLHLRVDQDDCKEKEYWSNALSISNNLFGKSQFDKRTLGKKTHACYHGVCIAYYYDARLAQRMMALQECLLDKILMGG